MIACNDMNIYRDLAIGRHCERSFTRSLCRLSSLIDCDDYGYACFVSYGSSNSLTQFGIGSRRPETRWHDMKLAKQPREMVPGIRL